MFIRAKYMVQFSRGDDVFITDVIEIRRISEKDVS